MNNLEENFMKKQDEIKAMVQNFIELGHALDKNKK